MERVTDLQFWMDGLLKSNLNSIVYNLRKDFDAVIVVTGSGLVRVGKSVLAQQVGYLVASKLGTPFSIDNIVFSGEELMRVARKLPKNSVLIYDEARGELDNKKIMEGITKALLDFFAECGMYNHCLILVLPDYFELPKNIAINRSECLLNVVRVTDSRKDQDGEEVVSFERGVFEFYNRPGKKMLYILGKKNYDDYGLGKKHRSFFGDFPDVFVVDKKVYDDKKLKHLARDRTKNFHDKRLGAALGALCEGMSQRTAATAIKRWGFTITQSRINQLIALAKPEDGGKT